MKSCAKQTTHGQQFDKQWVGVCLRDYSVPAWNIHCSSFSSPPRRSLRQPSALAIALHPSSPPSLRAPGTRYMSFLRPAGGLSRALSPPHPCASVSGLVCAKRPAPTHRTRSPTRVLRRTCWKLCTTRSALTDDRILPAESAGDVRCASAFARKYHHQSALTEWSNG